MAKESLRKQFQEKLPTFKRLEVEAYYIIENALSNSGIKIYSILSRTKDVDSFIKKVERRQSKNPFEDIQDLVGLRIVCLFLSDINRIGEIIRRSFKVILEDNKIDGSDASAFGYLSVHFIVELNDECSGPRYDKLGGLPFEIQVRTLAMDAWANISHYLDYKSEVDIPKELKRDFYALSGLFYVADTHFEMFFKSREKISKRLEESENQLDQEINLDSLTAYLHKRFPARRHSDAKDVSELVRELLNEGYRFIGDLDKRINAAWHCYLDTLDSPLIFLDNDDLADTGMIRNIIYCPPVDELYSPAKSK